MADEDHVKRIKTDVGAWNSWRRDEGTIPDLSNVDLEGAKLKLADLEHADLTGANLRFAYLKGANLTNAILTSARLDNVDLEGARASGSDLSYSSMIGANLRYADFTSANLEGVLLQHAMLAYTNLSQANLIGVNLSRAYLLKTIFSDVDLSAVIGLADCAHRGPSVIDSRILEYSDSLPLEFLRGVGLSDAIIEYLPLITRRAIEHYSCFISYSSKDDDVARRIHADLQNEGVRCWFAPDDMRIGGKILDEINSAIRLRDKLVLILSESSIKSDWVEDEVTAAFEEERFRGKLVLFPIRIDDTVLDTNEPWAAKLRARHIGDFRRWKEHDEYQKSFARVLRDLTVKKDG